MKPIYGADMAAYMFEDYKKTRSAREVSNIYFCSYTTVLDTLRRNGYGDRMKKVSMRKNRSMIFHDWQADIPDDKIIITYGFKDANQLEKYVSKLRKQGWEFKERGVKP